jgi:hypothetical protein
MAAHICWSSSAGSLLIHVPHYAGIYEGVWLGSLTTVEVSLEDGHLSLLRTPPYAPIGHAEAETSRLIPRSQDSFECTCGVGFIFVAEEGEVIRVDEVRVQVRGLSSVCVDDTPRMTISGRFLQSVDGELPDPVPGTTVANDVRVFAAQLWETLSQAPT